MLMRRGKGEGRKKVCEIDVYMIVVYGTGWKVVEEIIRSMRMCKHAMEDHFFQIFQFMLPRLCVYCVCV